jgi:hypothetical protein
MVYAETIDPTTDDLIDSHRSQLIQPLGKIEGSRGKFLLVNYLAVLDGDHPQFRGEIKTRRDSISKKGNCNFHICDL